MISEALFSCGADAETEEHAIFECRNNNENGLQLSDAIVDSGLPWPVRTKRFCQFHENMQRVQTLC